MGEVSPLAHPIVAWRLLMGLYTKTQEAAIRRAAAFARTRGDGHRTRLLEHEHQHAQAVVKGLRRTYVFSAANGYVQDVDYHDYDVIFGSAVAHEFRDLDDPNAEAPAPIVPESEIARLVSRDAVPSGQMPDGTIVART